MEKILVFLLLSSLGVIGRLLEKRLIGISNPRTPSVVVLPLWFAIGLLSSAGLSLLFYVFELSFVLYIAAWIAAVLFSLVDCMRRKRWRFDVDSLVSMLLLVFFAYYLSNLSPHMEPSSDSSVHLSWIRALYASGHFNQSAYSLFINPVPGLAEAAYYLNGIHAIYAVSAYLLGQDPIVLYSHVGMWVCFWGLSLIYAIIFIGCKKYDVALLVTLLSGTYLLQIRTLPYPNYVSLLCCFSLLFFLWYVPKRFFSACVTMGFLSALLFLLHMQWWLFYSIAFISSTVYLLLLRSRIWSISQVLKFSTTFLLTTCIIYIIKIDFYAPIADQLGGILNDRYENRMGELLGLQYFSFSTYWTFEKLLILVFLAIISIVPIFIRHHIFHRCLGLASFTGLTFLITPVFPPAAHLIIHYATVNLLSRFSVVANLVWQLLAMAIFLFLLNFFIKIFKEKVNRKAMLGVVQKGVLSLSVAFCLYYNLMEKIPLLSAEIQQQDNNYEWIYGPNVEKLHMSREFQNMLASIPDQSIVVTDQPRMVLPHKFVVSSGSFHYLENHAKAEKTKWELLFSDAENNQQAIKILKEYQADFLLLTPGANTLGLIKYSFFSGLELVHRAKIHESRYHDGEFLLFKVTGNLSTDQNIRNTGAGRLAAQKDCAMENFAPDISFNIQPDGWGDYTNQLFDGGWSGTPDSVLWRIPRDNWLVITVPIGIDKVLQEVAVYSHRFTKSYQIQQLYLIGVDGEGNYIRILAIPDLAYEPGVNRWDIRDINHRFKRIYVAAKNKGLLTLSELKMSVCIAEPDNA